MAFPARVLLLARNQQAHYEELLAARPDFALEVSEDWTEGAVERARPDLLATMTTDWWEADACLRHARAAGVPSLLIMDGIVEYRHQWEDPRTGAAEGVGLFIDCPADRIACLGRQSVRLLEGWGNAGRCEAVGSPRFDHYLTAPLPAPRPGRRPSRLLVMTANTPAFTEEQLVRVEASIADLRDALAARGDWLPIWRVRGGISERLSLRGTLPQLESGSLREALQESDAVVTTPSTAQLEAFLSSRPTALLDYTNRPHYVTAAWTITAKDQIGETLDGLASFDAARMRYQQEILRDALECGSPATPRLIRLVEAMIDAARRCRAEGRRLELPERILDPESPTPELDPSDVYPGNPSFAERDRARLQRELALARQEARTWRRRAELAMSWRGALRRVLKGKSA
jgi:hypothetical protein